MNKPIVENESINSTLSDGTIKTSKKANIPRDIRIFNSCPEGNSKLGKKLDVEASYLGRFKFFNLVRSEPGPMSPTFLTSFSFFDAFIASLLALPSCHDLRLTISKESYAASIFALVIWSSAASINFLSLAS